MIIDYKKLTANAHEPMYGTEYSAGADLRVSIDTPIVLKPGEIEIVPTGIAICVPEGYFGMVCSRSGLSAKFGVVVRDSPGIIDADYRGEIKLIMMNHSRKVFTIEPGMRLAQLVIVPYISASWKIVANLPETGRADGGIGSTGIK